VVSGVRPSLRHEANASRMSCASSLIIVAAPMNLQ
jgi:hypothetical protein